VVVLSLALAEFLVMVVGNPCPCEDVRTSRPEDKAEPDEEAAGEEDENGDGSC